MAEEYDVVVVGAGPGGSTCSALLAKWGLRTLLLDKNAQVGGKAMTLSRDGFRYEMWPIIACPSTQTKFEEVVRLLGLENKVQFHRPHPLSRVSYKAPSGEIRTIELPGAGQAVDPGKLFAFFGVGDGEIAEVTRLFTDLLAMPRHEQDLLDHVSVLEFLDRYKIPRSLYSFIASFQSEGTQEVPNDVSCASEFVRVFQDNNTKGGGIYPAGGFGSMYTAFADVVNENGGQVMLNARVEKITVEDGRVTGVSTSRGHLSAPIVVSNAGIQPTVLKLVGPEHFDKGYVNYVRDLVPSLGFAGVRYFLSKPVLDCQSLMFFSDNTVSTTGHYLKAKAGKMPEEVYVYVSTNSIYPGMAPEGKQLVYTGLSCPADPKTDIKPWIDLVEKNVARLWPDIMKYVERKEYYGPAEVSALSRDSVVPGAGGECVGLGQIVGQCGRYQPAANAPIRGLFYVGFDAGSWGFGNHKAVESGLNVARTVQRYFATHRY
jgi:phytoene dehydrogenase-like protein